MFPFRIVEALQHPAALLPRIQQDPGEQRFLFIPNLEQRPELLVVCTHIRLSERDRLQDRTRRRLMSNCMGRSSHTTVSSLCQKIFLECREYDPDTTHSSLLVAFATRRSNSSGSVEARATQSGSQLIASSSTNGIENRAASSEPSVLLPEQQFPVTTILRPSGRPSASCFQTPRIVTRFGMSDHFTNQRLAVGDPTGLFRGFG